MDAQQREPGFGGVMTFMKLPNTTDLGGVDVAVVGIPFDGFPSMRAGQRRAPLAVREMSYILGRYNELHDVDVLEELSVVDYGDLIMVPGFIDESYSRMEKGLARIYEAGVIPVAIGGDHSISLPHLRVAHRHHPDLVLVHLDAHADTDDSYCGQRYNAATMFRRAVEEELLDATGSIQVGMRGSLSGRGALDGSRDLGYEVVTARELHAMGIDALLARIHEKMAGRSILLSLDIDFVDPAYAPGTSVPVPGGPSGPEVLRLIQGLAGLDLVAYELTSINPSHDPGQITAVLGANIVFEYLSLVARAKRDRH